MSYSFENNDQQVKILRQRLIVYLRDETPASFGYGSLARGAGLNFSQRTSIQRFCESKKSRLKTETAQKIWDFLIEGAPNETLNENVAYASAANADFGASLYNFLELDIGPHRRFLKNFHGQFLLIRESWVDSTIAPQSEYVVFGHLYLDFSRDGTIFTYSKTVIDESKSTESVTEFEGRGYYHRGKFIIICKNMNSDIAVFSFHAHRPYEPKFEKVTQLYGNVFTVIGGEENNRTFRVCAIRVEDLKLHKLDIYKYNDVYIELYKEQINYIKNGELKT